MQKVLKNYALLWSMLAGALLSEWVHVLSPFLPYSLFIMLLLSYTKVSPRQLKPKRSHYQLFALQWTIGLLAYFVIRPFNELIAQGVALIFLTPTATSAPAVTGMLGGDVAYVTSYLLPSNFLIALLGPLFISILYPNAQSSYIETLADILAQVSMLLILPLAIIWFLRFFLPTVHLAIARLSWLTFYVWVLTVAIISASTVHSFRNDDSLTWSFMIESSIISLIVCVLLYSLGHIIAKRNGDNPSNGRQTLGQKNTILAIWIATTFMNPTISIIPTFYIIWQNLINSIEIAQYRRKS